MEKLNTTPKNACYMAIQKPGRSTMRIAVRVAKALQIPYDRYMALVAESLDIEDNVSMAA